MNYYLNNKENVLGFLDNDKNKCGKRLYGTPHLTYNPSILSTYTYTNIILVNTPYIKEMTEQLYKIQPTLHIHLA